MTEKHQTKEHISALHSIISDAEKTGGKRDKSFSKLAEKISLSLQAKKSDDALEHIFTHALSMGVSDVHFDSHETGATLRYRLDGQLVKVLSFDVSERKMLIERSKYRSELKLNIEDVPQDGKFRFATHEGDIDVRVSTIPTRYKETIVCRILNSMDVVVGFEDLGITWMNKKKIHQVIKNKQGMILVTGPTGSGKTTTLYTLLDTLNNSSRKIITLEDPIEYEMKWVIQSEIHEQKGYTFASGMRAILRQDPDVIMIGEIRDLDTANTAIQASMTGHLVLSTLHTKSAIETVERLMNMGIEPYDLASAVDVIIAQRLVRKTCTHCGIRGVSPTPENMKIISQTLSNLHIDKTSENIETCTVDVEGCDQCAYTGYRGRIGVFEILKFDDHMRQMIRDQKSSSEIEKYALKKDFYTLADDSILKVLKGVVDIREARQVTNN